MSPRTQVPVFGTENEARFRQQVERSIQEVIAQLPQDAVLTTLANDATPSVRNGSLFVTGGTTGITDFDDGRVSQRIDILAAHTVTITDGTNILLSGSGNFAMVAGDTLSLRMFNDQVWEEIARKVN